MKLELLPRQLLGAAFAAAFGATAGAFATTAATAQDFDAVTITTTNLGSGLYMLTGQGGNIGVSIGDDGVFLIDDQYAPLSGKILAAVRELSDGQLEFVINTHWHADHTGGNEAMHAAGGRIVAHDNVRARMSTEQFIKAFDRRVPASPQGALPVITFDETITLHLNGEEVHVFHVPSAHTDGDALVHFRGADVLHMGDTFFNGGYPFIDLSSGGSVAGIVAAADRVLAVAGEDTRIIPGHGPLASRADLQKYRDMVATVRERIASAVAAGQTLEQVLAAKPSAEFDATWGGGFMNPKSFVSTVYASESAQR